MVDRFKNGLNGNPRSFYSPKFKKSYRVPRSQFKKMSYQNKLQRTIDHSVQQAIKKMGQEKEETMTEAQSAPKALPLKMNVTKKLQREVLHEALDLTKEPLSNSIQFLKHVHEDYEAQLLSLRNNMVKLNQGLAQVTDMIDGSKDMLEKIRLGDQRTLRLHDQMLRQHDKVRSFLEFTERCMAFVPSGVMPGNIFIKKD